ncbi:MAG: hypothetical protein J5523_07500 [Muribaculaceae bacterium]|nr:hypothetical protein [Muribaculaceae bacterium]
MKKLLLTLALLLPMLAQALPFVPTTHPGVKPIHWYYLKTGGRFVYASESEDADIAASTSSQNNDAYYWCFVGDANSGYRIYNRATNKYLYAGEFLGNYNEPAIDKVETRDNSSFYIYTMLNSGTLKNYLCYNSSSGFYTTMGKDSYFTVTEAFVEQESQYSNTPDINVETFDDHCVVTATGTGEVHLYIGNDEVNNPYTIMRTNENQYFTAMATNKDPGKEPMSVTYQFTVPKLEGAGPNPNPTFTRYDADGVGYSFEYGGPEVYGCVAQFVVDNNANTYFQASPDNCYVVMQASKPVAVKQYSLVTAIDAYYVYDYMIRSWKLEGSNDFYNWTLIDTQKDYPMPLVDLTEVVIPVNDTRKFRYFKFTCTEGVYSNVRLSEIWINEQSHGQWTQFDFKSSTCGAEGERYLKCSECNAKKSELTPPDGNHFFSDGVCTKCGIKEDETRLIYNSQRVPHYVKAKHGYRQSNGTWPSAPQGWNTAGFNDSHWLNLPLGTANPGHTDGPRYQLRYNSFWFDEYNCYWMRFPLILTEIASDATFTFNCVHDDNMVVYVNGQEVINKEGWCETPYGSTFANTHESYSIPASAFHRGKNVIAVYMQQNTGGAYFDCELVTTGVTTGDFIPGDVNGDGKVNVSDVTTLVNMILGVIPKDMTTADVNGDGKVNVSDVTALVNIILGVH